MDHSVPSSSHNSVPRGLNYGCGERLLADCLNVDARPPQATLLPPSFLQHNATDPLPFPTDSLEFVFAQHFIEHIPLKSGIVWLTEVLRVLKPGGIVRLSTPDLRRHAEGYLSGCTTYQAQSKNYLSQWTAHPPDRPAWRLNQLFQFWGHSWIYDREELLYLAQRAGFQTIVFQSFGRSLDPRLGALDSPDREWESLYVDLRKLNHSKL
ncbi:MAG: methyltransferase domain-containing protein [Deltaproteobacteria bacterium]|nr:methyltransferase domain-containing protein [Deltaproteobacteria bacterium]MBI3294924.1 methyltransferase domain-containing protein [Deltaproteobacteria bacterium]